VGNAKRGKGRGGWVFSGLEFLVMPGEVVRVLVVVAGGFEEATWDGDFLGKRDAFGEYSGTRPLI
jgi:hypothetical protein